MLKIKLYMKNRIKEVLREKRKKKKKGSKDYWYVRSWIE